MLPYGGGSISPCRTGSSPGRREKLIASGGRCSDRPAASAASSIAIVLGVSL